MEITKLGIRHSVTEHVDKWLAENKIPVVSAHDQQARHEIIEKLTEEFLKEYQPSVVRIKYSEKDYTKGDQNDG